MRVRGRHGIGRRAARPARCGLCGCYPFSDEHRCAVAFEVRVPGVTRARRVRARDHEEAAVLVADALEREGRFRIERGCEAELEVRRVGWQSWYGVVLTAVDVTSYHPTSVQLISKPSRR